MIYAALVPGVIAAYGFFALAQHPAPSGETLRVGMVQSNLVDYEQRRRESGAQAVVREVLDTHFAMTYDAVERQRADAVLWSETVYPTTFGNPKSEAGAEFDAAIQTIVNAPRCLLSSAPTTGTRAVSTTQQHLSFRKQACWASTARPVCSR
jgi:apolipoprotein N-acyltransferase